MDEKYIHVLKRLYQTNLFKAKKVNLYNIQKASNYLDNPHKNLNFIHVTGTNGKGSVCKKLSTIFQLNNYKTGLYISPHISSFRERIQINSNPIDKDYLVDSLTRIYDIIDRNEIDLTYFEIITLLSLLYFKEEKVDIGIMEVGLGGNLDATNIIDPLVSVITSIGVDHTLSLGFTQREIAMNKAGIIKKNRPVVLGPDCFPKDVFEDYANSTNSPLFQAKYSNSKEKDDFDNENIKTVEKTIETVQTFYPGMFNFSLNKVKEGLKSQQPCRKEDVYQNIGYDNFKNHFYSLIRINREYLSKFYSNEVIESILTSKEDKFPLKIILDVAHNSHGLEKLCNSLKFNHPSKDLYFITAFSAHKNINDNIKVLCSNSKKIYLTTSAHKRLLTFNQLNEICYGDHMLNYIIGENLFDKNSVSKGKIVLNLLKAVIDIMIEGKRDILVICGSFFMMGDARKALGYTDEMDPFELNEFNPPKNFSI